MPRSDRRRQAHRSAHRSAGNAGTSGSLKRSTSCHFLVLFMRNTVLKLTLPALLLAAASCATPAFTQADDPLTTSIRKAGHAKVAMITAPPWMVISSTGEAEG